MEFKKLLGKVVILFIIAMSLFGCDALSTRMCHLAAKEYVRQKGYEIDTAVYKQYTSTIVTKDSVVIWIESYEFSYPYVSREKVLKDYRNK